MAPKCWKKMILSKHYKSVEKAKLKAKSKAQNSYLKHFENVSQNERVIVQIQNFISLEEVVFNEDKLEDLNECQNNMVIDENTEVEVELNDEQDLVICEEEDQDILDQSDDDQPDTYEDQEVFNSDNVEVGAEVTIDVKDDKEVQAANDNLIIKDVQAAHPYAVTEPTFKYQEKEELKNTDYDVDEVFAEEFTPVQPMLEGQEDYIPEDDQSNVTDFWTWIKRVKKQQWKNLQKKNIPWKNWKTKDFQQWFAQALVYQNRIQEPKSTPLFIKSLENTEHKRFMFSEMESSQNRRRCWKSLNFD